MITVTPTGNGTTTSTDADAVSEAIVTEIADAEGVSPLDVSPPLYEAIDPDALEAVIASMQSQPTEQGGRLEFAYSGYDVTVTEDSSVAVASREADER